MITNYIVLDGRFQCVEEDLRDGSAVEHVNWESLHTFILNHADTYSNVAAGMSKLAPWNQFHSSERDSRIPNNTFAVPKRLDMISPNQNVSHRLFIDNSKETTN